MTKHSAPTDDCDIEGFIRVLTELANRDDGVPDAKAEGAATVTDKAPAAAGS